MKRNKLNKRGKVTLTILTIILSAVIYVLMAKFGAKAQDSTIYQLPLVLGYLWLFIGQIGVYMFIWE